MVKRKRRLKKSVKRFLCLVIGDILLIIKELMKDKRLVYTISNSFFFIGMCLVALVL